MIRVRLKLNPGQRGTKKLLWEYGKKLVIAGGKWSKTTKTWKLSYKKAVQLGVKSRILESGNIEDGIESI